MDALMQHYVNQGTWRCTAGGSHYWRIDGRTHICQKCGESKVIDLPVWAGADDWAPEAGNKVIANGFHVIKEW